eukprot:COSAG06_NODE_10670_length_1639_cov_2.089610_3_plen_45_part_01
MGRDDLTDAVVAGKRVADAQPPLVIPALVVERQDRVGFLALRQHC